MEMNKGKIVNKLIEKSHKSIDECNAIYDVLMKNSIVGRRNKEKIKADFIKNLNMSEVEADKIYNISMEIILKNFFISK